MKIRRVYLFIFIEGSKWRPLVSIHKFMIDTFFSYFHVSPQEIFNVIVPIVSLCICYTWSSMFSDVIFIAKANYGDVLNIHKRRQVLICRDSLQGVSARGTKMQSTRFAASPRFMDPQRPRLSPRRNSWIHIYWLRLRNESDVRRVAH